MHRAPLLSCLVFSVAACGNNSVAFHGTGDGGGAGSGGDGGGPGTTSGLPSPGAVPANALAIVAFDHVQAGSGAAKNSANAFFFDHMIDLGQSSQYHDLFTQYAAVPIDTCTQLPVFQAGDGSQPMGVSAGDLSVSREGGGSYAIPHTEFAGLVVYTGDLASDAFVPLSRYTLRATGGAVPMFHGDFWTPPGLTVTAPVAADVPLAVTRTSPLDLAWNASGGDPVIVQLTQLGTTVTCRLTDDGAFTVPPVALAAFGDTQASDRPFDAPPHDSLSVSRFTWYTVALSSGPALVVSTTGAKYDVDLQ